MQCRHDPQLREQSCGAASCRCMLLPCHRCRHLAHRLAHLHAQHVSLAQQAGVSVCGGGAQQPGAGQQPRPLLQQALHCACQVFVACLACQARRGCSCKALGQDEPCTGGLQACAAVQGGRRGALTGRRGAADRGCTGREQLRCRTQTVALYRMVGSSRRCCRCRPSGELPTCSNTNKRLRLTQRMQHKLGGEAGAGMCQHGAVRRPAGHSAPSLSVLQRQQCGHKRRPDLQGKEGRSIVQRKSKNWQVSRNGCSKEPKDQLHCIVSSSSHLPSWQPPVAGGGEHTALATALRTVAAEERTLAPQRWPAAARQERSTKSRRHVKAGASIGTHWNSW